VKEKSRDTNDFREARKPQFVSLPDSAEIDPSLLALKRELLARSEQG
jgi:hypothetical protein